MTVRMQHDSRALGDTTQAGRPAAAPSSYSAACAGAAALPVTMRRDLT